MLDGEFDGERRHVAEQARRTANAAGAGWHCRSSPTRRTRRPSTSAGWADIDRGLALLDEAIGAAREAGRLDEVMRCYANRTTLLDLDFAPRRGARSGQGRHRTRRHAAAWA